MGKKEEQWLDTAQVCQLLGKTPMTIFNYRNGVGKTLKTSLPFYVRPRGNERHAVTYKRSEIISWAKKNGIVLADNSEK